MGIRAFRGWASSVVGLVLSVFLLTEARAAFTTFETGQVRPLAMSPDGTRLFAANTPDNRLEIFAVTGGGLSHLGSVQVGLEPLAVAARTNSEVWVVNHLSDSVSIVDVAASPPRVVRTLLVGDEPRDIVFAGPGGNRAFITTAHRGQNTPFHVNIETILTTQGIGRADVWVFDATNLGTTMGGTSLAIITLFGDTPRALAASPDGSTVYAAVFHSGNRTTVVSEGAVCDDGNKNDNVVAGACNVFGVTMPGGLPNPERDVNGAARPEVGLIVKFNGTNWVDELGRIWNNAVKFNLPDKDVFVINANATPPVQLADPAGYRAGVGTVLFNMVVNPANGKVYVTNSEAVNEVRFEGDGIFSSQFGGTTVQGHLHEMRITVLDGANVIPRHLNKHIDYELRPVPANENCTGVGSPHACCTGVGTGLCEPVKENSLAIPLDMAVTADGATLYVAAFGSGKIGVFQTAQLENDSFVPSAASHISVSGGGPSGLVLDEANDRLYALTRFDNGIAIIDTTTNDEVGHLSLYNPEPTHVVLGRPFLYDAHLTSANGEASCASCHIFGDFDSLAWDLGDPDGITINNPIPVRLEAFAGSSFIDFHPMKGPMTTQSLRGMANHGSMHWRGDRTGGNDPGGSAFDEDAAFKKFNVAFPGLLGRDGQLASGEMQAFTDFILEVTYPPNPIRDLSNQTSFTQGNGLSFMTGSRRADGIPVVNDAGFNCVGCHTLNPASGFFGTDGRASFENEPQIIKIAHLRNMYQKVGMFGMPQISFLNGGDNGHMGDQIRGYGFLHDGSIDTMFRFLQATVFNNAFSNTVGFQNDTQRREVEQFLFAMDSNMAPIVGQQVTLTSSSPGTVGQRIDLMIDRAGAGQCDLVVKGTVGGQARGWHRTAGGSFRSDRASEALLSDAQLRLLAGVSGQQLTYTAVPPGSGVRIGVDRDEDGFFDRTELDAGSDPADPASNPTNVTPTATATHTQVVTPTNTATASPTSTNTPTRTSTFTPTRTGTLEPTPTFTDTGTPTDTPEPTNTPEPTATNTHSPTITQTPLPTATATPDRCLSGNLIGGGSIKVSRNPLPGGDEKLTVKGEMTITNLTPPIDLVANGFRLTVRDLNGNAILTRDVPPGAGAPGWSSTASGFRFKDNSGSLAGGITKVTLIDRSGRFKFKIRGGENDFRIQPGLEPVRLEVVLGGDPQRAAGQCATVAFQSTRCSFSASGNTFLCR